MAAAAIIFFAFYGFDAIATAAEEAKNPSRDLAIGIVGSMLVCVLIYMVVAAAAIGAVAYTGFADSAEPLALILREIGQPWAARILGASAVIALPTVILAFFYGQSRIFFTVARDGLLPPVLARVSGRGTPVRITIFTAIVTSVFAGLIPLTAIAALANAGTLAAFVAVCAAMLVLRRREPNAERKFRAPAAGLVATIGILGCLYLFISLPNRHPAVVRRRAGDRACDLLPSTAAARPSGQSAGVGVRRPTMAGGPDRGRHSVTACNPLRSRTSSAGRRATSSNGSTGTSIPPSRSISRRSSSPKATARPS